jgi:NADH-quinone oxidoreductase subunit F
MRHDPHLLIEGCLLASFAMGAHACYVYVRGEYVREREALERAVTRPTRRSLIGRNNAPLPFDSTSTTGRRLYLRRGDGALESLEARRACRA